MQFTGLFATLQYYHKWALENNDAGYTPTVYPPTSDESGRRHLGNDVVGTCCNVWVLGSKVIQTIDLRITASASHRLSSQPTLDRP